MNKKSAVATGAGILMVATLLSRLLGYGRERVISQGFGDRWYTGAYVAAFSVPDLLYYLLAGGALSAAFIPVFADHLVSGRREQGWRVASSIANLMLLLLALGVILELIFAPLLVRLVAPGFAPGSRTFELTVTLSRVLNVMVLFTGLSALATGVLNSLDHFTAPAISWCTYSLCIIFGGTVIAQWLGGPPQHRIFGLALGVLLGSVSLVALQLPVLWRKGFRYHAIIDLADPDVKRVISLFIPVMIGLSISQFNLLQMPIILATKISEQANLMMRLAQRLMLVPFGMFGVSIATAAFPTLARLSSAGDMTEFKRTFSESLRAIFFFALPTTAALMALHLPVTRLLWRYGQYSQEAVNATALVTFCFALGLFGLCGLQLVTRGFYAQKDTLTPVVVGVVSFFINLGLCLLLLHLGLDLAGIALGTSATFVVNMLVLLAIFRRRVGQLNGRAILLSFSKVGIASTLMGLASWQAVKLIAPASESSLSTALLQTVVGSAVALAVFVPLVLILRVPEAERAWGMVARKFGLRRQSAA